MLPIKVCYKPGKRLYTHRYTYVPMYTGMIITTAGNALRSVYGKWKLIYPIGIVVVKGKRDKKII